VAEETIETGRSSHSDSYLIHMDYIKLGHTLSREEVEFLEEPYVPHAVAGFA